MGLIEVLQNCLGAMAVLAGFFGIIFVVTALGKLVAKGVADKKRAERIETAFCVAGLVIALIALAVYLGPASGGLSAEDYYRAD